ncbi:carbohydrate esterase family 4 protein [Peniophora sp. CONT]|nr:carbohydrate esterase family 4 protein [Peniophora sp. CONT]
MQLSSLINPSRALTACTLAALAVPALAQDRTTEQGEAQITDATQECTAYSYPSVAAAVAAGQFPPIWQNASLLPSDSTAQALWAKISPSVPTNIQPKGNRASSLANVTYDAVTDPDCWWTIGTAGHKCTTPKLAGLPNDTWFMPEPMTVGYGFDDGPNCSHNAFYDFLTEQNQKATMYYIGSNVLDWPLEAQRALADGHEICVHTWSHPYMTSFPSPDAFAELYYTMQAIKLATGVTPTCWRPPYGDVDDRIRAIAKGLGLRTIVWGYDSNDWQNGLNGITDADVDNFYQQFVNNATSGNFNSAGGIILTHELNNYTMSKAVEWYPKIKAAFKSIVPVGVGLNQTQPYVETNYSLPNFEQYVSGHLTANPSNASAPSNTSSSSSSSSNSSTSGGSSSAQSAASSLAVGSWTAAFAAVFAAALVL